MVQRWQVFRLLGHSSGPKCRDCMGLTDRPSCTTNFNHFIIAYMRMGGYRCYAGTTPRRPRTHVRTNAKDKLRPFATNSAFCGGFEPWTVCYFPHHPTTRPHVTFSIFIVPLNGKSNMCGCFFVDCDCVFSFQCIN